MMASPLPALQMFLFHLPGFGHNCETAAPRNIKMHERIKLLALGAAAGIGVVFGKELHSLRTLKYAAFLSLSVNDITEQTLAASNITKHGVSMGIGLHFWMIVK